MKWVPLGIHIHWIDFFSMFPFHSEMTSLLRIPEWQIQAEFRAVFASLFVKYCLFKLEMVA